MVKVGYAFYSSGSTLFIDSDVKSSQFFQLADTALTAFLKSTYHFTVKYWGKIHKLPMEAACKVTFAFMKCTFDGELLTQLDGGTVEHAINHGRIMLL